MFLHKIVCQNISTPWCTFRKADKGLHLSFGLGLGLVFKVRVSILGRVLVSKAVVPKLFRTIIQIKVAIMSYYPQ